jgi:hypothetical protein
LLFIFIFLESSWIIHLSESGRLKTLRDYSKVPKIMWSGFCRSTRGSNTFRAI